MGVHHSEMTSCRFYPFIIDDEVSPMISSSTLRHHRLKSSIGSTMRSVEKNWFKWRCCIGGARDVPVQFGSSETRNRPSKFDRLTIIYLQDCFADKLVLTLFDTKVNKLISSEGTKSIDQMAYRCLKNLKMSKRLTGVWMSMALWSLICRTMSRRWTAWLASIIHMAVSIAINTPVLPIPALQSFYNYYRWFHVVNSSS